MVTVYLIEAAIIFKLLPFIFKVEENQFYYEASDLD